MNNQEQYTVRIMEAVDEGQTTKFKFKEVKPAENMEAREFCYEMAPMHDSKDMMYRGVDKKNKKEIYFRSFIQGQKYGLVSEFIKNEGIIGIDGTLFIIDDK